MGNLIKNNALVIVLLIFFLVSFVGLFFTGFSEYNQDQEAHRQSSVSITEYAISPHFGEAIFENWESEFLQMFTFVVLTIFLKQKGASDSKKLKGKQDVDASSKYSLIKSFTRKKNRKNAFYNLIYSNSLGLALLIMFLVTFALHAFSGVKIYNEEALAHQESQITLGGYLLSTQFWFESFQNWQSEFLSVATLLILSIFLRQRGSPESKPIGEKNRKTGD